jgi:preprotein translocase subunit SecG
VALSLIGLILLQHGKGADMGATMSSGASQTLFGSTGSASFLQRLTAGLALLFFITSLSLGHLAAKQQKVDPLADLPATGTPGINPQVQPDKAAKPASSQTLPG